MIYKLTFSYEGIDYNKWDKTFKKRLQRSLKRAGRKLASSGPLSMKSFITKASSIYAQNSPFYRDSKNGKGVLYNTGFLRNAPTFRVNPAAGDDYGSVSVGILNDMAHPSGSTLETVVGSIVKDREWSPTPEQRAAYWAKMRKAGVDTSGAKYRKTWSQPKRDFIRDYPEKIDTNPIMEKAVMEALHGTLKATKSKVTVG